MNLYNLALFLLTLVVVPLFFLNGWLSLMAGIAIYCLLARLANKDLDRQSARRGRPPTVVPVGKKAPSHDLPRSVMRTLPMTEGSGAITTTGKA